MARNKSEKELSRGHGWVLGTDALSTVIPIDKWTHVAIVYDASKVDRKMQISIPTERGIEVYEPQDDGSLKLLRTIKGGTY